MGLLAGAPAPWFNAPSPINPTFAFSSLGGHYIVMAFLPPPGPERDAAISLVLKHSAVFEDDEALFFGVLPDEASFQVAVNRPPLRWFGDWSGDLRRLYGAIDADGRLAPSWVVIDPMLRVMGAAPLGDGERILRTVAAFGRPEDHTGSRQQAPVLMVPRVLEPALCQQLVDLYRAHGGEPSGIMQERDGKTVGVLNDRKRRRDAPIVDDQLRQALNFRIMRRLLPEIEKAFHFKVTRLERHIVACYAAADGGYFRPHRDNTTSGTAHRQFAVSINLNADDYQGGDLRFPEFGRATYRPPTGGALVFSCSLLHEATAVTRGVRYAFLPFLYDEAGAALRRDNLHLVEGAEPSTDSQ